jgi:pimeloyl-ACP methyl ester carboxylesterase
VLLDRLSGLEMPKLIVWGVSDRVFPVSQAREATARLREAPSRLYLPAVTCPTSSALTALWAPSAGSSVNSLTIKEGRRVL